MKDAFGGEIYPEDYCIMWSDNAGRQLLVQVKDYNPATKKIKVERQDTPGRYEMKTFWTNAHSSKFYLLIEPNPGI